LDDTVIKAVDISGVASPNFGGPSILTLSEQQILFEKPHLKALNDKKF